MKEPSYQNQRSSPQGVKDGVSRIIPIQVEKGKNAFSNQANNEASQVREVPISINNLDDLKHHQRQNNAEDSIRGYTKPQVHKPHKYILYNIFFSKNQFTFISTAKGQ